MGQQWDNNGILWLMAIDVPNSHVGWLMKIEGFLQKLKNNRFLWWWDDHQLPANGTNQLPAQSYFYQKDIKLDAGSWCSQAVESTPDMGPWGPLGTTSTVAFRRKVWSATGWCRCGWLRNPALVDGNPMILAMGLVQDFATIDSTRWCPIVS